MGYTTHFSGEIEVSPPLNEHERNYLKRFSESRRMKRSRGPYFVDGSGDFGQGRDADVDDSNRPPESQPGLWCNWVANEDGSAIEWDGAEKFYDSVEWMAYLIDTFLKPGCTVQRQLAGSGTFGENDECRAYFAGFTFDHVCNGEIEAEGEDPDDRWLLVVENNEVEERQGTLNYEGTLDHRDALSKIAAGVPREDEWRSAADFMERVASILDEHGIERPEHYSEEA